MSDHTSSLNGRQGHVKRRSPHLETAHEQSEAEYNSHTSPTTASVSRRRPSRVKSSPNDSPQSISPPWVDIDKEASRKAKAGRATTRKDSGIGLSYSPKSPKASRAEVDVNEKGKGNLSGGFFPKLGRIVEGKENNSLRKRRGNTISSLGEALPVHHIRRPNHDASLGRKGSRQKHGSLKRRTGSLSSLANPSLVSVLSELTQQSSTSSRSNSTITQKPYGSTPVGRTGPKKQEKRKFSVQSPPQATKMATNSSNVFQYANENLKSDQFDSVVAQDAPPFPTSTAPSQASSHDETQSSDSDGPDGESPLTSPASARMPEEKLSQRQGHRIWHVDDQHSLEYDRGEETDSDDSSEESDHSTHGDLHVQLQDDEDEDGAEGTNQDSHALGENPDNNAYTADELDEGSGSPHHLALDRIPPPRLPSATSSRHSDPHTRRLRNRERELRNHVFESPRPHRDFQFAGGPSPNFHQTLPLYDTYSDDSPTDFPAGAPQPPGWPPPAPAPPPVDYYSPAYDPPGSYSSGAENSYAMAANSTMGPPTTVGQHGVLYNHHQLPHHQPLSAGPDLTKTTVLGYELLARKLTEEPKRTDASSKEWGPVPVYRKFEQLNHRILLHLQDEIAELEEELRYLDECIAQLSPRTEHGQSHPASRRADARFGGELHYRRTELLGRIYLKLGQYNQALSSFSTMVKTLDPAKTEDVDSYRSWMERHTTIESNETRFLDRQTDLLAISRRRSASIVGGVGSHQSAAVGLPLIAMLPLMAFAIVPSLLGRLFIITLIGAGEVMVVTSTELIDFMTLRDWSLCASIPEGSQANARDSYFGLMAVLAAVVH